MRTMPPRTPPELNVEIRWRELWRAGCFIQQRMVNRSAFASAVSERFTPHAVRPEGLEWLDETGAVRPIAFAAGGEPPDFTNLAAYDENMSFREEQDFKAWSEYAWDAHGYPHTTALYSPWQALYIDDAVERAGEALPVHILLAPAEEREAEIERLRGLLERLDADWRALDERWAPLMKLLVRLQNRYLPEVTDTVNLPFDTERGERVDPYWSERDAFDPRAVVAQLGVDPEQILNAYWFLVERGIDRDPRDEMEGLRRTTANGV